MLSLAKALTGTIKCGELVRFDIHRFVDSGRYVAYVDIHDMRTETTDILRYRIYENGEIDKLESDDAEG
jgi:hypothetical protein